jgi:hypothetical protein
MPIEAPSHTAIDSRAINSEFVICQNFVFRLKNWGGVCLDQKGLYWEILV